MASGESTRPILIVCLYNKDSFLLAWHGHVSWLPVSATANDTGRALVKSPSGRQSSQGGKFRLQFYLNRV